MPLSNDIISAISAVGGIVIGAASRRIAVMLNKKKEETILNFKVEQHAEEISDLKEWKERAEQKLSRLDYIEGLLNGKNK